MSGWYTIEQLRTKDHAVQLLILIIAVHCHSKDSFSLQRAIDK